MDPDMEIPHDAVSDVEVEYIPFYGVLKMNESKKEVAKKKLLKAIPHTEEAAIAAAEMLVATVEEQTLEEAIQEAKEWVKPVEEYTPTDFAAVNDPPEPGTVGVATTPRAPNVVRRGFTTIQMARAFLSRIQDSEDYLIVEVREANGMMLDGPILAHYVIHKSEEQDD
jgi:hypothetical protein